MEVPFGDVTMWCSLLCKGNPAVGELTYEFAPGEPVSIPVCEECKDRVLAGEHPMLDLEVGPTG